MFGKKKKEPKTKSLTEIKNEAEAKMIACAEELTALWEEAYLAGSRVKPWISWADKEVFIVQSSSPKRIKGED